MTSNNIPEIRFDEFNEEWKQFKLGDVVEIKDSARISNTLWVSKGVPYLRSSDLVNSGITGELFISDETYQSYKAKTGAPEKDDVLFTSGGKVGVVYHKVDDDPIYVQGGSILYAKTSKSSELSGTYLATFFSAPMMARYIDRASTGLTLKHFTLKPAKDAPIFISSLKEQNQIGEFFNKINEYIYLLQQELTTLKQTKQGFLQKMFPKEGESVPELRFPGFTGEWDIKTLKAISNYRRGSFPQPYGNKEWYDEEDGMPFVQVVDVGKNLKLVNNTKQKISKAAQPKSIYVESGKVVVTLQGSIGRVAITQYPAYVDRTLLIFENFEVPIDEYYFAYSIQLLFNKEKMKAPGGTIKTITKEALSSFPVFIPDKEEQVKIGSFFKQLDDVINLHESELDDLEQTKKAFLQKMFV